jgi:hypothetical protein
MATNIQTQVDLVDVKTVLQLEPRIRELFDAVKAALPAVKRLSDTNYAGAPYLADTLNNMLYDHCIEGHEADSAVLDAIKGFRIGGGDKAAYDYHDLVVEHGMDVGSAMAELLDRDSDDVERVDAFSRYARAQARP